ncbi:hypothetical protein B7494_g5015 [Chlorociboria aeruginascens]|nr:hypothetical protein B7494_g5015 [Chlorociboria aeruginascens]
MKRKNDIEESQNEETSSKRTRSGRKSQLDPAKNSPNEVQITPMKRKYNSRNLKLNDDIRRYASPDKQEAPEGEDQTPVETPLKRGPGRPKNSKNRSNGATPTKRQREERLFETPVKHNSTGSTNVTPRIERNADRSARRKSTRTLIERTVLGNISDDDEQEEDVARHIYDLEGDAELEGDEIDLEGDTGIPTTPSKRGRPSKAKKARQMSPTPPRDLPPHELYISQNRTGRTKTSNLNLSSLALLDHEEFFKLARNYKDPHIEDIEFLQNSHVKSFNQWHFEIRQNFNICLYGWGSKRSLLMKFAEYLYKTQTDHAKQKIVIVNGYVNNLTIRDVFNTFASAISDRGQKLGSQQAEMVDNLAALLEADKDIHITVIVHSIDGSQLRRPATQTLLSRLSSHPQVNLIASADHPSFPLLWDSSLRSTYNFLFHDCTTFQKYTSEIDVVDEVHELLGRSGRRVGGKEGVSFVLKSLPENAKNLFRVLIGEQLAAMDGAVNGVAELVDDDNPGRPSTNNRNEQGVEYRLLYQKTVEEFICSNEMNFRTLLKERNGNWKIADLATLYNGEIINGDAMQMYDGLPIITNKIIVEEQKGIPHHLLGFIALDEDPWRVGMFKENASKIIREIRSRGKLPIVVGGTHYYTQSLLSDDWLVNEQAQDENVHTNLSNEEISRRFPILDGPSEAILERLKEVDPVMADRWHPKDLRKIRRSLEIFLTTGRRASDIYKEQEHRKHAITSSDILREGLPRVTESDSMLLFWIHSQSEVLKNRLDNRVEKMIKAGMLDEVKDMNEFLKHQIAVGKIVDQTRGIWASIGWKEFAPYLSELATGTASQTELETLYNMSVEQIKAATRQYARRQVRWIRLKLLASLSDVNSLQRLYLLDGTDLLQWTNSVWNPAFDITRSFLAGEELRSPIELSDAAREMLAPSSPKFEHNTEENTTRKCEMCHVVTVTDVQWQSHIRSRCHRGQLKKIKRNAGIRTSRPNSDES